MTLWSSEPYCNHICRLKSSHYCRFTPRSDQIIKSFESVLAALKALYFQTLQRYDNQLENAAVHVHSWRRRGRSAKTLDAAILVALCLIALLDNRIEGAGNQLYPTITKQTGRAIHSKKANDQLRCSTVVRDATILPFCCRILEGQIMAWEMVLHNRMLRLEWTEALAPHIAKIGAEAYKRKS